MDLDDPFWRSSFNISPAFKEAVGELVISCARLEVLLGELIAWSSRIESVHIRRILFGGLSVGQKVDLAKKVLAEQVTEDALVSFRSLTGEIAKVMEFRNQLAHAFMMPVGENAVTILSPKWRNDKRVDGAAMEVKVISIDQVQSNTASADELTVALSKILSDEPPPLKAYTPD